MKTGVRGGSAVSYCVVSAVVALAAGSAASAQVQVEQVTLASELAEPFCYFLVPSDVLGFKDCPEGTQVTCDGAFNTGFGEFMLHAGREPRPVNKRVKTLHRGYLPIIEYTFDRDGARYKVQAFAAPLDLDPRNNLVNFVQVTVENPGKERVQASVVATFAPPHGETRHKLACQPWYRDRFMDASAYQQSRVSKVADGQAWRSDHLAFTYPADDPDAAQITITDDTLRLEVPFRFALDVGETRRFRFKFPYVPIHRDKTGEVDAFQKADYDSYLARTIGFWEEILASATGLEVPEAKVVNTMKASLIYDLIARDITEDGQHFVQKVNEFQYDSFYPRDSAYFIRTYDLLGLHEIAAETLEHFLSYDEAGRLTGVRRMMPDDWGQSLWSLGAHYRATGDIDFARRVYPAIPPHVEAFTKACAEDPLGLWPVAGPYDNEAITGHYTGHSFWALLGLREAVNLASAVGEQSDAARFQRIHDEYRARFMERLRAVAARAEGYIPPGIDDPDAGYDWANASGGVYPFGVLEPHDPLVTATVDMVREYKYREGIMTYGPNAWAIKQAMRRGAAADPGWLHHYETMYVVETLLARGEQRKVIEDFYSILAHTGSTNSGFEFSIRPWGNRDPGGNRPPHGWFAARYNSLFRNMLVREEGQNLHLASAVSPVWLQPGKQIRVTNAATNFGTISYTIDAEEQGARLTFDALWRKAPERILFHMPWFCELTHASEDGSPARVVDGGVVLSPVTKSIALRWRWRERPTLDYETAVRSYLETYHNRPPNADYSFLFPTPRPPRVAGGAGMFIDAVDIDLAIPGGIGTVHFTIDGSPAGPSSPKYTEPIRLTDTTSIRAITVWDDGRTSEPVELTLSKVSPRTAEHAPDLSPGLDCAYYEGAWDRLPEFAALDPVQQATVPAFALGAVNHREEEFAVRFAGYIEVPQDGIYTFYTASDDGSALYIGSTQVVDNDGLHAMSERAGQIALAKGKHPITVAYFERGGAQRLEVSYSGPRMAKQPIPASVLFRERR